VYWCQRFTGHWSVCWCSQNIDKRCWFKHGVRQTVWPHRPQRYWQDNIAQNIGIVSDMLFHVLSFCAVIFSLQPRPVSCWFCICVLV